MYKKCSKCKEEKLFSEFNKNKTKKDGYQDDCKSCVKSYLIEYRINNKDKILESQRIYQEKYKEINKHKIAEYEQQYYEANKESIDEYRMQYRKANKEKMQLYRETNRLELANYNKQYKKSNRAKINAIQSKRRAIRLQATPSWLTHEDLEKIEEFYKEAQDLKLATGQGYHVDHIVPLQGEIVCGLHVPWNLQVITASENRKKYNKLLEE